MFFLVLIPLEMEGREENDLKHCNLDIRLLELINKVESFKMSCNTCLECAFRTYFSPPLRLYICQPD